MIRLLHPIDYHKLKLLLQVLLLIKTEYSLNDLFIFDLWIF